MKSLGFFVYIKIMKIFIVALFILLNAKKADASTAECATIRDHDTRMMCFAGETGNGSYCNFIKDHDTKIRCRILSRKQ